MLRILAGWLWLRGDRKYVMERSAALSGGRRYIASLPRGRAASLSDLRRSCIMAWQHVKNKACVAVQPEQICQSAETGQGLRPP